MARIALQQISSKQAEFNALSGLRIPKKQEYIGKYLKKEEMKKLKEIYGNDSIHLWGAKYAKTNAWANMIDNSTLILFRKNYNVVMRGICSYKVINDKLAETLWGKDGNDNETWPLIYFITKLQKINLKAKEVNLCLGYSQGYNWQGLNTVKGEIAAKCIEKIMDKLKERRV